MIQKGKIYFRFSEKMSLFYQGINQRWGREEGILLSEMKEIVWFGRKWELGAKRN
jgi:hypothetical protein